MGWGWTRGGSPFRPFLVMFFFLVFRVEAGLGDVGDWGVSGYLEPKGGGELLGITSGAHDVSGFDVYITSPGSSGQHTMCVALSTCCCCSVGNKLRPWWAEDVGAMTFYCRPLATPGLHLRVRMELDGTLGGSDD